MSAQPTSAIDRARQEAEEARTAARRTRHAILAEVAAHGEILADELVAKVARDLEVDEGSVQGHVWALVHRGDLALGDRFQVSRPAA